MESRADLTAEELALLARYRELSEKNKHLLRLAMDSLAAREKREREQRY